MATDSFDNPEKPSSFRSGEQLNLSGFTLDRPPASPSTDEVKQFTPEAHVSSPHERRPQPPRAKRLHEKGEAKQADAAIQITSLAPMMRQYIQIKREYPEHLLLFQVGDFYEVFFEDAKTAAEVLGIRLTSRDKDSSDPVPMCGVPIHALDNYLPKILKAGFSCVVMSQVEDAKDKKGMVRREITRIVTPGVRYEGDGLDERQFNYLAAACVGPGEVGAVSFVDVSTGHLHVQETESAEEMTETLRRIAPSELLLPSVLFSVAVEKTQGSIKEIKRFAQETGCRVVFRPFDRMTKEALQSQIGKLLPPVGAAELAHTLPEKVGQLSPLGASVLKAILSYVEEVSFGSTPNLSDFTIEESSKVVFIDAATRRNLELTETRLERDRRNSLLHHIDYTRTAMGSRLLTDWVLSPSGKQEEVEARYDSVEELLHAPGELEELRSLFAGMRDIDRLLSRVTGLRATPRDLGGLLESAQLLPRIKELLAQFGAVLLAKIDSHFDALEDVQERLKNALAEDLPLRINEGGIFRDGFNAEIDRLRHIRSDGHRWLIELEEKERKRTGIGGLKIRYNNIFGYFIEVTRTHLHKVPQDFERKQTLVNAERFVTKELKDYELSMLSAKAKLVELERELFVDLRNWIAEQAGRIQQTSRVLGILDVLCSYAHLALAHNYCRPVLGGNEELVIKEGRHPVVERVLGAHNFIANDTYLNCSERRFAILTGPNMGGKSTYLRQVALIQLLAQAGSFVPAKSAKLPLVDRIFTRIGAADDLSRGDSTFMVEMKEAASIVRKATSRSLVLIDEVGRGTATTDGLALATAISEWLHDNIGCITIFATHFHELTRLSETKHAAFCLAVGVLEKEKEIFFTHRIEEKAADRSYGIEVARLAGLPEALLVRAQSLLELLEEEANNIAEAEPGQSFITPRPLNIEKGSESELSGLSILRTLRDRLRSYHPDAMTPLQALHELVELKQIVDGTVE
jgi:DNA mismatch repair protein MutS